MKKERAQTTTDVVETAETRNGERPRSRKARNHVRKIRESLLLSKAELARKAGISSLTVDRIESGYGCRMDTKRKIILALGLKLAEKDKVFEDEGEKAED